jgi:hypothetical protein
MQSNEASAAEYQSYSERPEWSDITPIPQHDDSFKALVPIFYAAECSYLLEINLHGRIPESLL